MVIFTILYIRKKEIKNKNENEDENENDNDNNNKKKIIYIVNNSTNFDIFAVLTPPKPLCVVFLQHFDD